MASIETEGGIQKVHAGAEASWPFTVSTDASEVKVTFDIVTGPDTGAPEWDVMLDDSTGELWSNFRNMTEVNVQVPGKGAKLLKLALICPKGARYGDTVEVTVNVDDGATTSETFKAVATQSIMILKTQIEKEREVANDLFNRYQPADEDVDQSEMDVYAVLSPAGLRGYVFVEGMNTDRLKEKTREIKKSKYYIDGETSIDEINPYLTPVSAVDGIVEGDIVELVNGPFKGEKARVQHIDQIKEEIKVELIEAMVPIPVTVKGDSVRVIEKER